MKSLLAALLLAFLATNAHAQSCDAARAQLAAAQNGGGGGAKAAALRQRAAAYGCNTNSMFGRAPQCASIEAQLRRASGGADSRTLRRLRQQVSVSCAPPKAATRTREARAYSAPNNGVILHGTQANNALDERSRGGNFFTRLFGGREAPADIEVVSVDPRDPVRAERVDLDSATRHSDASSGGGGDVHTLATGSGRKGNLREGNQQTVCVRLCDGFYFPINSRSHSDNYYEELAMCVGRCPGADVSLYVHSNGSAVESMRSTMTGEAYVRLPTAFVYRKSLVPDCGCQPQTTIAADATAEKALSYVGIGTTATDAPTPTAEAAAASVAGDGQWTPFKAVYDETGEPLDLFKGLDTGTMEKPATVVAASSTAGGSSPAAASVPSARMTPVAMSSVTATPSIADDESLRLREVGGQFYSRPVQETVAIAPPDTDTKFFGSFSSAVTIVPVPENVKTAPRRPAN